MRGTRSSHGPRTPPAHPRCVRRTPRRGGGRSRQGGTGQGSLGGRPCRPDRLWLDALEQAQIRGRQFGLGEFGEDLAQLAGQPPLRIAGRGVHGLRESERKRTQDSLGTAQASRTTVGTRVTPVSRTSPLGGRTARALPATRFLVAVKPTSTCRAKFPTLTDPFASSLTSRTAERSTSIYVRKMALL